MKTLIIKSNEDSFERYFSKNMKKKNVDIGTIKKGKGNLEFLRKVINKLQITSLYAFWLDSWKKKIKEYDNIIIFDRVLSLTLVKWIISNNKKCNLKIWLWNIPNFDVNFYKKYAEIFCFDKEYSIKHKINFIDQFYIPVSKEKCKVMSGEGVIYVGYDKNRYAMLRKIAKTFNKQNIPFYFALQKNKKVKYDCSNSEIDLLDSPIKYDDLVERTKKFKGILELNVNGQTGITLRSLESIFYKKKLITNNVYIKKYPFYNKNNYYILGVENRNIREFLNAEYQEISTELLKKYSYDSWLKAILQ